jgi:hypothetical protein
MALIRCRHCSQETDNALATCQHCGQPLRPSGLMSFLKPRGGEAAPKTGEPPSPSLVKPANPLQSRPTVEVKPATARLSSTDNLPDSAVIFFHAEEFFAVRASGERSLIARLFGSALDLHSLCTAMLFTAYASLVENGFAQLQVAAVTPTGAIIFPIPAQWIKLIFEQRSLYPSEQESIEGMLTARMNGRLSSSATQQLIADLIDWQGAPATASARPQTNSLQLGNRHYAEALCAVIRKAHPNGRASTRAAVEKTETMLQHFYQQHRQVATYLSHEISLIMHWVAARQDAQLQQRHHLIEPNAPSLLIFAPASLYEDEFWRTIARYASRQP